MRIVALVLALCLSSCATSNSSSYSIPAGPADRPDLEVRYGATQVVEEVPLFVNLSEGKSKELFLGYTRAIKIEQIVCDGMVLPFRGGVVVDEDHLPKGPIEAASYLLWVPVRGHLVTAAALRSEGAQTDDWRSVLFPEEWKRIEIEYRIRFPDASLSRLYTARFLRLE